MLIVDEPKEAIEAMTCEVEIRKTGTQGDSMVRTVRKAIFLKRKL